MLRTTQIEDKVILKTFLRWVRTSANFVEVPWLIIEPKVSIIPCAWNYCVSGTFLTAESFFIFLNDYKYKSFFENHPAVLCKTIVCLY